VYADHGQRLGWPDDSTLRRSLGGTWNDCLRGAALAIVDDGDAVVREIGGAFTREEVITAIHECARDTQDPMPSFVRYLMWARRADVRRRPGRRPSSQAVVTRLFGGWADLLVAAGMAERDEIGGVPRATGGGQTVYRRSAYAYTDEQILAAVRLVAERLGRSPSTSEYARERELLFQEDLDAGKPARAFPSLASLQKRVERWDDLLTQAGLEPRDGRHRKNGCGTRRSPRRISDREYAIALRDAYLAVGEPFTQQAYDGWAKPQRPIDKAERRYRRLPGYYAVWMRFGTWRTACEAILAGWDPASDPVDPGEHWTTGIADQRDQPSEPSA
jgi:hypothetical protein